VTFPRLAERLFFGSDGRPEPSYAERMRRSAPVLAAALALGLTGCQHGSVKHQATARTAPPTYTLRAVQQAFARAGVWLARDLESEAFMRGSGNTSFVAFLEDATGEVQVNIVRAVEPGAYRVVLVQEGSVDKTLGNVTVTYRMRSPQAPRVLRALSLLGATKAKSNRRKEERSGNSRYWQGDGYCVAYDRQGAGGSVRQGTCPEPSHR
jgi:hypothetical protein